MARVAKNDGVINRLNEISHYVRAVDFQWLLGARPPVVPQQAAQRKESSMLKLVWLRDRVCQMPPTNNPETLRQYARCYIMILIGDYLMTDKLNNLVHLRWLPLLEDFGQCRALSWGSTVLAWTCQSQCLAAHRGITDIAGCTPLLMHSMWRAHIRGLLPFPTLVTSLAELADVPWEDNDVTPPPPDDDDKEVTIPWGVWVHERPPTSRRSRARASVEAAIPSSLTAAPPPSAPEPTYLLVQRLFQFLERERLHVRRRLDRMDQALISLGAELPPLPDSPTSDEQDHQEEDADEPLQRDAPPAAPNTTEIPQTHEEPIF
ncbi:hypothetical protein Ahy_B02g058409 [Arachis hypogaea]|uniref:Aminotransferase-like plant mobile domain-containing protein n=1 Tax=Arachis hypogaea TaxID=3818 RepID=A0A445AEL1_ARAHY|nr:hypothetical protein Ahy_B02g058409 [Arachis hypogaea]